MHACCLNWLLVQGIVQAAYCGPEFLPCPMNGGITSTPLAVVHVCQAYGDTHIVHGPYKQRNNSVFAPIEVVLPVSDCWTRRIGTTNCPCSAMHATIRLLDRNRDKASIQRGALCMFSLTLASPIAAVLTGLSLRAPASFEQEALWSSSRRLLEQLLPGHIMQPPEKLLLHTVKCMLQPLQLLCRILRNKQPPRSCTASQRSLLAPCETRKLSAGRPLVEPM